MYTTVLTLAEDELSKYGMTTLDKFIQNIEKDGRSMSNQLLIGYLQTFLIRTDYIVSKLSEYLIAGVSLQQAEQEYQKILDNRQLARQEIDRLKQV